MRSVLTLGVLLAITLSGCGHNGTASGTTIGASAGPAIPIIFSHDLNAVCKQAEAAQLVIRPAQNGPRLLSLDVRYLGQILTLRAPPSQAVLFTEFRRNAQRALKQLQSGDTPGAVEIYLKNRSLALKLDAPACRRWGLEPTPAGA